MIAGKPLISGQVSLDDLVAQILGECSIPTGGLDISGIVATGILIAFDLTPQIQKCGYFTPKTPGSYNPSTGQVTVTASQVRTTYIVTAYSERTRPESYQAGDELLIVKMADLIASGIDAIDTDSTVIDNDGTERRIVDYTLDPTRQILLIQSRKIGL